MKYTKKLKYQNALILLLPEDCKGISLPHSYFLVMVMEMTRTCNIVKDVRTHKQRLRLEEEEKEERNKRMCIEEKTRDLGTILTQGKGNSGSRPKTLS